MGQEANYSVTVKTLNGNLVTVRGDTAEQWKANLEAAGTSGALGVIKQIEIGLAAAAATQPTQSAQPSPSSPAQELPAGFANPPCGVCGHTTRYDKSGISQQSGRPYKRFLCAADSTHKATFTD